MGSQLCGRVWFKRDAEGPCVRGPGGGTAAAPLAGRVAVDTHASGWVQPKSGTRRAHGQAGALAWVTHKYGCDWSTVTQTAASEELRQPSHGKALSYPRCV